MRQPASLTVCCSLTVYAYFLQVQMMLSQVMRTHTHTEVGEKRADNNSAWKANAGEGGGGKQIRSAFLC